MVCKALLGIFRMEEDLHPGGFGEVEAAGLPSGCVQPLGLQSVLRGPWQPGGDANPGAIPGATAAVFYCV